LRVEAPQEVSAGSPLMVTIASDAALPDGTSRVVHLELATPDGVTCDVYTRNVRVESGTHRERFDLAFNDPSGCWQLNAHDLITGRVVQTSFTFRPS